MSDFATSDRSFASRGVVRAMAVTLEAAAMILLLLNLPLAITQMSVFAPWWTIACFVAVVVPAVTCIGAAVRARPGLLMTLCGWQAAAMLVLLAVVPVALDGKTLPASLGVPWTMELTVIAGSAAAVAWKLWITVAYSVLLQACTFVVVFASVGGRGDAVAAAVFGLFYVTLFTALALTLRQAGATLDATVASAVLEARASADAEAARAARLRVASLIHDSVIVALLSYVVSSSAKDAVRIESQRALDAIDNFAGAPRPVERQAIEVAWEIQSLTTELDPDASFDYVVSDGVSVQHHVAEAVTEATSEALRNSIRHALNGSIVSRQVRVGIEVDIVEVVVLDDGAGFDPGEVPPTRLGIRHGIIGRMQAVSGGAAVVRSSPGYGTVVAIRWVRP